MIRSAMLMLLLGCAAVPAAAFGQAAEEQARPVNLPGTNWDVTGTSKRVKGGNDDAVPGGQIVRVTVQEKGANSWDVAAHSPVQKPIGAGDVIMVAFYARAPMLKDGETTTLGTVSIGSTAAPYTKIVDQPIPIGNGWKLYTIKGTAKAALPAGTAEVQVGLADDKRVIELGPVYVLDYGTKQDISKL